MDFVKGFLVVTMVLYHAFNYFSAAGYGATKYVRFVTGAFIFISGYIVATYYGRRFAADVRGVTRRLIIRGSKILLLFTVINLALNVIGVQSHKKIDYGIEQFVAHLGSIYVSGSSPYSVFEILVPISYLLFLSPFVLLFRTWKKAIFATALFSLLMYWFFSLELFNLYGLLIGFVGLSIGLIVHDAGNYSIKKQGTVLAIFAFVIFFMEYFDRNILSYCAGVVLILKLVYDFTGGLKRWDGATGAIVLLGQYSLACYLTQILFMQILYRILGHRYGLGYEVWTIFVFISILLVGVCRLLDVLRRRIKIVDRAYGAIFS